jgi:hypothetical protein
MGGTLYAVEEDAWQGCEGELLTRGWCCENGDVYRASQQDCEAIGGTLFTVEEDAWQECDDGTLPSGWCCENGDVYYSTEHDCLAVGGTVFPVEEDAWQECDDGVQPSGWCCENGDVYYSTEHDCLAVGGTVFPVEEDAWQYCESQIIPSGWCCVNGQVHPESQAMCTWNGGHFFPTYSEAEAACQAPPSGMPDLVITEVRCDVGNQRIEYTLANLGNGFAAGGRYTNVAIYSGGEIFTIHHHVNESLNPGETYRGTINSVASASLACDTDITVCADHSDADDVDNLVVESNESNNCLQITCPPCVTVEEGWCCRDGNVVASTQGLCLGRIGGTYFSTQREAIQYCGGEIPGDGWCCRNGTVLAASQDQCTGRGGTHFTTQELADASCPPYIRYFTVSPTSLSTVECCVTLSWEVVGADDITLSGVALYKEVGRLQQQDGPLAQYGVALSGTTSVEAVGTFQNVYGLATTSNPVGETDSFTLTASNSAGTVTRTVSVLFTD